MTSAKTRGNLALQMLMSLQTVSRVTLYIRYDLGDDMRRRDRYSKN